MTNKDIEPALSEIQGRVLAVLKKRSQSLTEVSVYLGINRLVASSALRALERKGFAQFCEPLGETDQWSKGNWYAK